MPLPVNLSLTRLTIATAFLFSASGLWPLSSSARKEEIARWKITLSELIVYPPLYCRPEIRTATKLLLPNRGRISSLVRALDLRAGRHGFDSLGQTNTQGLEINQQ